MTSRIEIGVMFLLYIGVLAVLGIRAYRQTNTLSDYILGGRSLGSWVAALSAGASDMSGWLLLGLPGYAYLAGFEAVWIALGLLVGTYLNWRLVAPRLRYYSEKEKNSLTLPEYFENRFRGNSHLLRVLCALFVLFFFIFYTSAGLVASGKLFNSVFGLPYHWAIIIGTAIIVLYTFIGGFLAVSWTDVFQGLLMSFALVLVPVMALSQVGGWQANMEVMTALNPGLVDALVKTDGSLLTTIEIASLLGWGLGYFGQPHVLARFMAIRDPGRIAHARKIAMVWVFICMGGALLAGISAIGFLQTPPGSIDSEKVFIMLVEALSHPLLAGILLAAILAAIMSTADSQLLVSASTFTEDLYKTLWKRNATQGELVAVGRYAVIVIAVIAISLAWDPGRKVLELVAYAWAGFGAAFGPAIVMSLYWKRMNYSGALAGVLSGGITVVVWKQLQGGIFDLYEIIPGFLLSMLAIWVVSWMTNQRGDSGDSHDCEQAVSTQDT